MGKFSTGTAKTDGNKTSTNNSTTSLTLNMKLLNRMFLILFTMGIGFLMLMNVQPWLQLAEQLTKQITIIPFLDSLVKIPLLGGWIEWFAVNIARFLGLTLWGIVQFIEIIPMFVKDPEVLKNWIEAWQNRVYELGKGNPAVEGIKKAFNNIPEDWMQRLYKYRGYAYAIETIVCFLRFPPYEGGMAAILEEAPNWDASLIDWWNLVFFIITMFGFEVCFRVVATLWQGVRYVNWAKQ
jgi:hypothetical protein